MSATAFDISNPKRSDFHLVMRAIKNGWPIPEATRNAIKTYAIAAKMANRTDRLSALADQTLAALAAAGQGGGDATR